MWLEWTSRDRIHYWLGGRGTGVPVRLLAQGVRTTENGLGSAGESAMGYGSIKGGRRWLGWAGGWTVLLQLQTAR